MTRSKMNILLLFAGATLLFMSSCGDDDTSPPDPSVIYRPDMDVVYNAVSSYQLSYIRSLQSPSGAIKDKAESTSKITPYFANFAALALLKFPTAQNTEAVKNYLIWYMGKLNGAVNPRTGGVEIAGSVYDYYGEDEITKSAYDSVDSYAATFLLLAKEYAELSDDNMTWLQAYADKLTLISQAMEKCIDTENVKVPGSLCRDDNDGLSVASHVYDAKYLMDNCEVNLGLKAAIWLKEKGLITSAGGDFAALLAKNTAGIESELWRNGSYNWYDNGSSSAISNWNIFYPDGACQLYPGLFEAIDPVGERANRQYTAFNRYYTQWSSGRVYSGDFPWTMIVYAAAMINDAARTNEYLEHIYSYNTKDRQKDYWYSLEAACVVMAIDKITHTTAPEYVAIN